MKLQNLLLPQTGICTEECMYFRKFETEESKVDFTWDKDYIPMEKETAVSFDTYFNGCSVEKWFKYTKVRSISLHLHLKGQFRVTLMRKEKKLDGHTTRFLREETVGEENVEGNYSFLFESESNNGMLCFGLKCMSEEGVVYGGWYEGEVPQEEIRRVKMALVICTFKREHDRLIHFQRKSFVRQIGRQQDPRPEGYRPQRQDPPVSEQEYRRCRRIHQRHDRGDEVP